MLVYRQRFWNKVLSDRPNAKAEKWLSRLSRKNRADLAILLEQLLLSEGLLQIFTLAYDPVTSNAAAGLSQVTIAKRLNKTQSSISRKIDRGCKLIRSYLREHYSLSSGYE